MREHARKESAGNAIPRMACAFVFGVAIGGVGVGALAQTPRVGMDENAIAPPAEIPFRMYRDFAIVAEGSVGGRNKLHFLIDTGASSTVIDDSLARKLHLKTSPRKIPVFERTVLVEKAVLSTLRLGPLQITALAVVVQDISFLQDVFGVRIDAVVGIDVLSRGSFTIDYERQKLIWGAVAPLSDSVTCDPHLPYPTVSLQVGGRTFKVYLDTGAQDLALFENRIGVVPDTAVVGQETRTTLRGQADVKTVELHELTLGTTHWGQRRGLLMEGSLFDGTLGPRWLGAKCVRFDFERRVVSWSK